MFIKKFIWLLKQNFKDPHGIEMQMMSIISDQKTPYFARFARNCTAIPLPKFEMNENAFQGTAICFVNDDED